MNQLATCALALCCMITTGCQIVSGLSDYQVGEAEVSYWVKSFGGADQDLTGGVDTDSADNVIFGGGYSGKLNFGGGPHYSNGSQDLYVAKLDKWGNYLWSQAYGGASADFVSDLAVGVDDTIVVSGPFAGIMDFGGKTVGVGAGVAAMFIIKLAADGTVMWTRELAGFNKLPEFLDVEIDPAGDVIINGPLDGTVDFKPQVLQGSDAGQDMFLGKLAAATGATIWVQHFVSKQDTYPNPMIGLPAVLRGLSVGPQGDIFVAGTAYLPTTFGQFAIAPTKGWGDVFVARMSNSDGEPQALLTFTGTGAHVVTVSATDEQSNVLVCGVFTETVDFEDGKGPRASESHADLFMIKLNKDLEFIFVTTFRSQLGVVKTVLGPDQAATMIMSADLNDRGEILLSGVLPKETHFGDNVLLSAGDYDVLFAKFDPSGVPLLSSRYGDPGTDWAAGGGLDGQGDLVLAGFFEGQLNFGDDQLLSAGDTDIFVVKLPGAGQ